MRQLLLAGISMIAFTGVASANEPINLNMMPLGQKADTWVVGGDASFEWVRLAPHRNVMVQFDLGSGYEGPALQADAEGWNFTASVARDMTNGWRFGAHASAIDADGSARTSFLLPTGTPLVIGELNGAQQVLTTFTQTTATIDQTLDVDLSGFSLGVAAGQALWDDATGQARVDFSLSYRDLDTDYLNQEFAQVMGPTIITTATSFETRSVELVGHVWGWIPLGGRFRLGGGASAGFAFKDIEMDALSMLEQPAPVFVSTLHAEDDHAGFLARVDVNVGYAITETVTASVGGGFAFDSATPAFVAPDYITGASARIDTKSATSPYAGVRVNARF